MLQRQVSCCSIGKGITSVHLWRWRGRRGSSGGPGPALRLLLRALAPVAPALHRLRDVLVGHVAPRPLCASPHVAQHAQQDVAHAWQQYSNPQQHRQAGGCVAGIGDAKNLQRQGGAAGLLCCPAASLPLVGKLVQYAVKTSAGTNNAATRARRMKQNERRMSAPAQECQTASPAAGQQDQQAKPGGVSRDQSREQHAWNTAQESLDKLRGAMPAGDGHPKSHLPPLPTSASKGSLWQGWRGRTRCPTEGSAGRPCSPVPLPVLRCRALTGSERGRRWEARAGGGCAEVNKRCPPLRACRKLVLDR
jgi:hypothetical protein